VLGKRAFGTPGSAARPRWDFGRFRGDRHEIEEPDFIAMIVSPIVEPRLEPIAFRLRPDTHHLITWDVNELGLVESVSFADRDGFARVGGEAAAQPHVCQAGIIGLSHSTADDQPWLGPRR